MLSLHFALPYLYPLFGLLFQPKKPNSRTQQDARLRTALSMGGFAPRRTRFRKSLREKTANNRSVCAQQQ